MSKYPLFYDSPEYLRESFSNNLYSSLQKSHEAIHPIYLVLIQLIQRVIPGENAWELSLVSSLFGFGSFILFYLLINKIFNEKIALYSLIPLVFFKHVWLIQTNILHESIDHFLLIAGIYFLVRFLGRQKYYYLFFSILFMSLAILNFLGTAVWFISLFSFICLRKKIIKKDAFYFLLVIILSLFIGLFSEKVLLEISGILGSERLINIFNNYWIDVLLKDFSLLDIFRTLRNIILILVNGYSIASIVSIITFFVLIVRNKDKRLIVFSFLFLIPLFITGKYWYGGLFGRYSSFIAYYLAIIFSFIYQKSKNFYYLLTFIVVLSFIYGFVKYQKTSVYLIQQNLIDSLDLTNEDIIILSDYQRPQLEVNNAYYLTPDSSKNLEVKDLITKNLGSKKTRVFITKQAINYPYWQYDGQEIHIVSKGDIRKAVLFDYLKEKEVILTSYNQEYPNLDVYEIKSN